MPILLVQAALDLDIIVAVIDDALQMLAAHTVVRTLARSVKRYHFH